MKKLTIAFMVLVMLDLGVRLWNPMPIRAQTTTGFVEGPVVVSTLSACYWLAPSTNAVAECWVNTGVPATSGKYFSLNGSTVWTPMFQTTTTATVTSLNGKTGALTISATVN